jgi:hypothetical protein
VFDELLRRDEVVAFMSIGPSASIAIKAQTSKISCQRGNQINSE